MLKVKDKVEAIEESGNFSVGDKGTVDMVMAGGRIIMVKMRGKESKAGFPSRFKKVRVKLSKMRELDKRDKERREERSKAMKKRKVKK